MSKFFIFFFVCSASGCALAQNQKVIDSLEVVLRNTTGGDQFPALYELAFQYLDWDNEKALKFISKAEFAALLSGDSLWIVKSKRVKGQILYRLERLEEAARVLLMALRQAERNDYKKEEGRASRALGTVYLITSRLAKALEYHLRSWALAQDSGDSIDRIECLNNIGMTYYKLGDFDKALRYYRNASLIQERDNEVFANLLVNIALCHTYLEQFSKADSTLRTIREMDNAMCSDESKMHLMFAVGLNYYKTAMLDSAEGYFLESLRRAQLIGDQRMISDNLYFLGDIYLNGNVLSDAGPIVHMAMTLAESDQAFPETRLHAYKRLSEYYLKAHRFRDATVFQTKYIDLKDSIYSQEQTIKLMAREVEFAQQQNSAKIAAQSAALRLNREIMARQRIVNLLIGALGVIALIALLLLFRNLQRKKLTNTLLERKVRQRTHQLENSRNHLAISLKQQRLMVGRASAILIEKINTAKGLCHTASKENMDQVAYQYFTKIDGTLKDMRLCIKEALGWEPAASPNSD